MNVSNKLGGWPIGTWGWSWNYGSPEGKIKSTFRGKESGSTADTDELFYYWPDTRLQPGAWTHIAWTIDYNNGFRCQLWINGVLQRSTVLQKNNAGSARTVTIGGKSVTLSWDGETGDDKFDVNAHTDGTNIYIPGQTYAITSSDYLYFGGAANQGSAVDGVVDDFQVWDKAMDADDVKQSMQGFGSTLPSHLLALWDFEDDADEGNAFAARGVKAGAEAWSYEISGEPESYNPQIPSYDSGCPFLTGTAYPVVTTATWKDAQSRRTVFEKSAASRAASSEDEAGEANVTFASAGDHNVTLTLENSYGSSVAQYPVFKVLDPSAIDGVETDGGELRTYTVDRLLFLEFAEAGSYNVQVYNTAGMLMANSRLESAAGETARVELGTSGIYMVKVMKDGTELRTIKIAVK